MINKYKGLVAPIIALIAIGLKLLFDVEVTTDQQNQFTENVVEIVALVITLIGVIKNNVKKEQ